MAHEAFLRVVRDAGLGHTELATLYGVSRQTIHYWIKTAPPREGSWLARMESVITAGLISALDRKVLPFAAVSAPVRAERIARMAKTLQKLQPAPAK